MDRGQTADRAILLFDLQDYDASISDGEGHGPKEGYLQPPCRARVQR